MSERPAAALETQKLTVQFGGVVALDALDLAVRAGSRHGILGPNGSGKTTLFNALSGLVQPSAGSIQLFGEEIGRVSAHRRARLGMARTFQITSLFPTLTVHANVAMAARVRLGTDMECWRPVGRQADVNARADQLLEQLHLTPLRNRVVRSLGYGEQRQLEIAVSLVTDPRVLLLDEPTAGLSAAETGAVTQLVAQLPETLTVVIIEHDLGVIFELTDHLTVLQNGQRIADGPSGIIRDDPVVKAVYLGG